MKIKDLKKNYRIILIIIVIIALIAFFFPKSAGYIGEPGSFQFSDCDCIGIKILPQNVGPVTCFGIPTICVVMA